MGIAEPLLSLAGACVLPSTALGFAPRPHRTFGPWGRQSSASRPSLTALAKQIYRQIRTVNRHGQRAAVLAHVVNELLRALKSTSPPRDVPAGLGLHRCFQSTATSRDGINRSEPSSSRTPLQEIASEAQRKCGCRHEVSHDESANSVADGDERDESAKNTTPTT
jgi:hypothetical protein